MGVDTRPAAIYCRISDDPQGRRLGVDRQEKACRLLAHQRGWSAVEIYVDNDISAFSGVIRPAYRRLLEDLQLGRLCAVVAWDADRLHRSTRELEDFIDLIEQAEIPVLTVTSGFADFDTATGRMQARIKGTVSRYESEHKTERIAAGMASIAEAGRWQGGQRPYGYECARDNYGRPLNDGRLLVVPEEAAVVREAAARVLAGETVYKLALEFNARGLTTTHGARWRSSTLRRILTNATTAGKRSHHGVIVADALWPALIHEADWSALRQMLMPAPGGRGGRSTRSEYLLSRGIAWCGACGERVSGYVNDRRDRRYSCPAGADNVGCGRVSCSAPQTERVVVEALLRRRAGNDSPHGGNVTASGQPTCALDAVADLLVQKRVSAAVWQVMLAGISSIAENRADQSYAAALLSDALVAAFDRLPFDVRRQRILDDVTKVVIHPTKMRGRFDPNRIEIQWATHAEDVPAMS